MDLVECYFCNLFYEYPKDIAHMSHNKVDVPICDYCVEGKKYCLFDWVGIESGWE